LDVKNILSRRHTFKNQDLIICACGCFALHGDINKQITSLKGSSSCGTRIWMKKKVSSYRTLNLLPESVNVIFKVIEKIMR